MEILSLFCHADAFQEQLKQIRPKLYRVAFSWSHNSALADDLVQETLIKALRNKSQLRDSAKMNGWLFSILANCWRDHFRRNRMMEDIDELEEHCCVDDANPESDHEQSQIVSRVLGAVSRLPMGQRQVLTLVDLEEFSYIEVAGILSIPVGTVMSRLCRARQTLKLHLKEFAPDQSLHRQIRRVI